MVLVPLYTALLIAGAFIKIPLPPVPITLQTLVVFVSSLTLDWKKSSEVVLLYFFLGLIGLPVFSSGGGIAAFTGPTAGYIWALLPASFLASALNPDKEKLSFKRNLLSVLLMEIIIYIGGLCWLKYTRSTSFFETLVIGLFPFIPGDVVKIAVATAVSKSVYKEQKRLFSSKSE